MISGCSWPNERTPRMANLFMVAMLRWLSTQSALMKLGKSESQLVMIRSLQRVVTR